MLSLWLLSSLGISELLKILWVVKIFIKTFNFCFQTHKTCSDELGWNWLERKCKRREGNNESEKEKEGGWKGRRGMYEYDQKKKIEMMKGRKQQSAWVDMD